MAVTTALELKAAIQQGMHNIFITQHMDLSTLPLDDGGLLGFVSEKTGAIIVRPCHCLS